MTENFLAFWQLFWLVCQNCTLDLCTNFLRSKKKKNLKKLKISNIFGQWTEFFSDFWRIFCRGVLKNSFYVSVGKFWMNFLWTKNLYFTIFVQVAKIFGPYLEFFRRVCRNCIHGVQKNILRKRFHWRF